MERNTKILTNRRKDMKIIDTIIVASHLELRKRNDQPTSLRVKLVKI